MLMTQATFSALFTSSTTELLALRGDVKIQLPRPQCAAAGHHWLLLKAKTIIFRID